MHGEGGMCGKGGIHSRGVCMVGACMVWGILVLSTIINLRGTFLMNRATTSKKVFFLFRHQSH